MIHCEIILNYENEKEAEAVAIAVENENKGYVKSRLEGRAIRFEISSEDPMSLSHTVNDLLSCVKAAENSMLEPF